MPPSTHPAASRTALLAGGLYFLLVFAVGFALGVVRTLWLVPAWGVRTAELAEVPVMLVVMILVARWLVRRFDLGNRSLAVSLAAGVVALGLLVAAELWLILWLQQSTVGDYLAGRDPVSGGAYAASLLVFALLPTLVAAWHRRRSS
ncbi:MAG: hypothetical protein SX243_13965 [Acidobacteriota bacterium]|nr:hypothetical protein [Acidobacteriota bacterium]